MASKDYRVKFPSERVITDGTLTRAGYTNITNTNSIVMNFRETLTLVTLKSITIPYHFHLSASTNVGSMDDIDQSSLANLFSIVITNTTQGNQHYDYNWSFDQLSSGSNRDIDTATPHEITVDLYCQIPENTTFSITIYRGSFTYKYYESDVEYTGTATMQTRIVEDASLDLQEQTEGDIRMVCTSVILADNNSVIWGSINADFERKWVIAAPSGQRWRGPDPGNGQNRGWETVSWPAAPVLMENYPTADQTFFDWVRHEPNTFAEPDLEIEQPDGSIRYEYSYYPVNPSVWRASLNYDIYHYQIGHWEIDAETHEKEWVIDEDIYPRKNNGLPWIWGYGGYIRPIALFLYVLFRYLFKDSNNHSRLAFDLQNQQYYTAEDDISEERQWVIPGNSIDSYSWEDEGGNIVTGYTPENKFPKPIAATAWKYTGTQVIEYPQQASIVDNNKTQLFWLSQQ